MKGIKNINLFKYFEEVLLFLKENNEQNIYVELNKDWFNFIFDEN